MTIRFHKHYQLHKCCSLDEDLRISLRFVHFQNGYAYATNAHVLVKISINEIVVDCTPEVVEALNNHSITGRSFARVMNHKEVTVTKDGFVYENEYEGTQVLYKWFDIEDGCVVLNNHKHRIPNMDAVLPNNTEILTPIPAIGINVQNLLALSQAMGGANMGSDCKSEILDLYFTSCNGGIICRKRWGEEIEDVVGMIMPCIIDNYSYSLKKATKQ